MSAENPNKEISTKTKIEEPGDNNDYSNEILIPNGVEETLLDVDWDNEKGDQKTEYTKFTEYIKILDESKKQEILDMILQKSKSEPVILEDYIFENGYIIDEITLQKFEEKFGNKNEKYEKKENQKIINLINAFDNNNNILQSSDGRKILDLLKEIEISVRNGESIEDKKVEIKAILQKPGVLESISQGFIKNNDIQGFQIFKNFAVSLDKNGEEGFKERFQRIEILQNKDIKDLPVVYQAQIISSLGGNYKKEGNILQVQNGEETIKIDIGTIPPTRYINSGKFTIQTELPIGNFYKAISNQGIAFEKTRNKNLTKIKKLKDSKNDLVSFLSDEEFINLELPSIKKIIFSMVGPELYTELGINTSISKEQLKKEIVKKVEKLIQDLQSEINEKKLAYEKALKKQILIYEKNLKKQDEKTRQTLELLEEFHVGNTIGEKIFYQVINYMNSGNLIAIGDNKVINHFNIEKFIFKGKGLHVGEGSADIRNQIIMARIINKMITGDPTYPINIVSINGTTPPTFVDENHKFKSDLKIDIYIKNKIGITNATNPFGKIIKNLEKPIETQNKNNK